MYNEKFYNINHIINANAIEMVNGGTWIKWSLDKLKKGHTKRRVNRIAATLTE